MEYVGTIWIMKLILPTFKIMIANLSKLLKSKNLRMFPVFLAKGRPEDWEDLPSGIFSTRRLDRSRKLFFAISGGGQKMSAA